MQNNSNRGIDRVFFFLASAAENDASDTNRFAIHRRNVTTLWAAHLLRIFRARKKARIVDHTRIAALQGHHLAKSLQCLSRGNQLLGLRLALYYRIRGSA